MQSYEIESEERWFNSVATGVVMELMTKRFGLGDPATTYTIGLLHDIGKTAIDLLHEHKYSEVLDSIEEKQITLQEAEKKMFGYDHAEIGAALLRSWEFPESVIQPIEYQFRPNECEQHKKISSMLHLSKWICAGIGGAPGTHAWAFRLDESVFEELKCSESDALQLMLASKEEIQHKKDLLKI